MTAASCLMALNPIVVFCFFFSCPCRTSTRVRGPYLVPGWEICPPSTKVKQQPPPLSSPPIRNCSRMPWDGDAPGRRTFADGISRLLFQGWRILHADDSHRRPRKEEDRMTSFPFPPSGVIMSTSFLGPVVSGHPLRCIPWNFTAIRDNDAMADRRNAHRRQRTAIATNRSLLYSPHWFAVPKRTASEKADDPFRTTLETGVKHLSDESRDEQTPWNSARTAVYIVKLVFRFLLTSSSFTTVSFVRFSFFYFILFVKTNLKGEDAVNVPHWSRNLWEESLSFCACQAKKSFVGFPSDFFFPICSWKIVWGLSKKRERKITEMKKKLTILSKFFFFLFFIIIVCLCPPTPHPTPPPSCV